MSTLNPKPVNKLASLGKRYLEKKYLEILELLASPNAPTGDSWQPTVLKVLQDSKKEFITEFKRRKIPIPKLNKK